METNEAEVRIRKWENGINISQATKEDLHDYCKARIHYYTINRQSDENLWDLFQEDFKDFDTTAFGQINRTELYVL
jgi:hypothetical protein